MWEINKVFRNDELLDLVDAEGMSDASVEYQTKMLAQPDTSESYGLS